MAFIVYPAGLTKLPGSSFFSFLFFLMLSLIGLDTQFINIGKTMSVYVIIIRLIMLVHKCFHDVFDKTNIKLLKC